MSNHQSPSPFGEVDALWVTVEQAAEILARRGVQVFNPRKKVWNPPSLHVVRKWCAEKRLKVKRKGWRYFIHLSSLDSFTPPSPGRPHRESVQEQSRKRRGKRKRLSPPRDEKKARRSLDGKAPDGA